MEWIKIETKWHEMTRRMQAQHPVDIANSTDGQRSGTRSTTTTLTPDPPDAIGKSERVMF